MGSKAVFTGRPQVLVGVCCKCLNLCQEAVLGPSGEPMKLAKRMTKRGLADEGRQHHYVQKLQRNGLKGRKREVHSGDWERWVLR